MKFAVLFAAVCLLTLPSIVEALNVGNFTVDVLNVEPLTGSILVGDYNLTVDMSSASGSVGGDVNNVTFGFMSMVDIQPPEFLATETNITKVRSTGYHDVYFKVVMNEVNPSSVSLRYLDGDGSWKSKLRYSDSEVVSVVVNLSVVNDYYYKWYWVLVDAYGNSITTEISAFNWTFGSVGEIVGGGTGGSGRTVFPSARFNISNLTSEQLLLESSEQLMVAAEPASDGFARITLSFRSNLPIRDCESADANFECEVEGWNVKITGLIEGDSFVKDLQVPLLLTMSNMTVQEYNVTAKIINPAYVLVKGRNESEVLNIINTKTGDVEGGGKGKNLKIIPLISAVLGAAYVAGRIIFESGGANK